MRRAAGAALLAVAAWLGAARAHPLDPLSAEEIEAAAAIVRAERSLGKHVIVPLLELDEPDKPALAGDEAPPRRAVAIVRHDGKTFEAVVDLDAERLDSWRELPGAQPRMTPIETLRAMIATRLSPEWKEAVAARGIENGKDVETSVISAGVLGRADEEKIRLARVVTYDRRHGPNYWAYPLEGLVVTVDLDRGRVVRVDDDRRAAPLPEPGETGGSPARIPTPEPAAAAEPDASIELDGHLVSWRSWRFHLRLDARPGLVLSLVRVKDGETWRSVLHQASLAELFVPYAEPSDAWRFRGFLDAGEVGIGANAARLVPERHCPARARFVDAVVADSFGKPEMRPSAICLFEREPAEPLWVHEGRAVGGRVPRLGRELVVRSISSLGNYDYVFDWVFLEEGTIRVAVGATGVALAKRVEAKEGTDGAAPHGRFVAPHTVAVNHDHFMSYRLDLDVDGAVNDFRVDEIRGPRSGPGPWTVRTRIAERETKLHMSMEEPAQWRVANPSVTPAGGSPASYELRPGHGAMSLFPPRDALARRGGFAGHALWVTPYAKDERFAAGPHPVQALDAGLPTWTANDRPLGETDVVLWYTLGFHHVVRTEDWPIMPTKWHTFELRPFDFFAENPVLPPLPHPFSGSAPRR